MKLVYQFWAGCMFGMLAYFLTGKLDIAFSAAAAAIATMTWIDNLVQK